MPRNERFSRICLENNSLFLDVLYEPLPKRKNEGQTKGLVPNGAQKLTQHVGIMKLISQKIGNVKFRKGTYIIKSNQEEKNAKK